MFWKVKLSWQLSKDSHRARDSFHSGKRNFGTFFRRTVRRCFVPGACPWSLSLEPVPGACPWSLSLQVEVCSKIRKSTPRSSRGGAPADWFNPLGQPPRGLQRRCVWFTCGETRADRSIACSAVCLRNGGTDRPLLMAPVLRGFRHSSQTFREELQRSCCPPGVGASPPGGSGG